MENTLPNSDVRAPYPWNDRHVEALEVRYDDTGAKQEGFIYKERNTISLIAENQFCQILLVHVTDGDYWKLPGGEYDPDEDLYFAGHRETTRETGCSVIVSRHHVATVETWEAGVHQTSHCYLAKQEEYIPNATKNPAEGLDYEWMLMRTALMTLFRSQPTTEIGATFRRRDLHFLQTRACEIEDRITRELLKS